MEKELLRQLVLGEQKVARLQEFISQRKKVMEDKWRDHNIDPEGCLAPDLYEELDYWDDQISNILAGGVRKL